MGEAEQARQVKVKVINMEGKEFSRGAYLSRFCRDNGITVYSHASDVKRKKDL